MDQRRTVMHSLWITRTERLLQWERLLRKIRDTILLGAISWCLLALLFALWPNALLGFIVTVGAYVGIAAIGLFAVLSVAIAALEFRMARDLVRGKHEQAVELLLEVMEFDDGRGRASAGRALVRALPQVRSLTRREIEEIHDVLLGCDPHRESALMAAFLMALARFGGQDSLEVAGRIATLRAITRPEKRVHKSALECIAAIRRRLDARDSSAVNRTHAAAA